MVNKLFFKFKPVDYLRKLLNKILKFKYESKVLIHNIMVIGLLILIVHILLAFSVKSDIPMMVILLTYFIVPFALYFNKKNQYVVSEIIRESDNIITLKLKPKQSEIFNYVSGQFIYVRVSNPNVSRDEHPFTMSSSPDQKDYICGHPIMLEIQIKNLKNLGVSSQNIHYERFAI